MPDSNPQTNNPSTLASSAYVSFLIKHGFLDDEGSKRLAEAGVNGTSTPREISNLLLDLRLIQEEDVAKSRAAFLNLPYINLTEIEIPNNIMNLVSEESRHFYNFIPFELTGNDLKVAITDPSNVQALEALEFLGQKQNYSVHIYVASQSSVDKAVGGKKNIGTVVGKALKDIQLTQPVVTTKGAQAQAQVLEDAPIIKIVDVILTNAVEANASDIHIEPSENDVRVRYRIDGILHTSLRLPSNVLSSIISRIKILSNLKIDEQRLPQDGRFHLDFDKRSIDFRVSTLPLMFGEKVVMRILDKTSKVPTLDQLGIRGKALEYVMENIKKTHGVFLITGPTGSGKSTTLYSILSIRNTPEVNIVTLEDPVEYFMEGVNQSQVKAEIGLTFAAGLRSILRQDPNIVMVGEIRDQETAELGVHAALTGHLVFSTLHTNNSVGAMPRLTNMGIEPFLLSASVNLVMAQRLIRKLCLDCREEAEITPIIRKEIEKNMQNVPEEYLKDIDKEKYKIYKAVGCEKCGHIGYKGRFGIFEALPLLPELQELIFGETPIHKVYEAASKYGVITMKQDGIIKALLGETTFEEIARVTTE